MLPSFPDLAVNGKQTLAENIADVAGLAASYDAYHASLAGKKPADQDGFTGEQQFFLAYGQTRASKPREGALRQQVLTDPHAPARYRTDTMRNIDPWCPAFQAKEGEKLYLNPEEQVRIWWQDGPLGCSERVVLTFLELLPRRKSSLRTPSGQTIASAHATGGNIP